MKVIRVIVVLSIMSVLVAQQAVGGPLCCGAAKKASAKTTETELAAPALCGACGEVKGSSTCCAKDAVKCKACGLTKGSPGCCKIEKGADVALCPACGEIKGSDKCCDKDAAKCKSCGLIKGSPGCCKIK